MPPIRLAGLLFSCSLTGLGGCDGAGETATPSVAPAIAPPAAGAPASAATDAAAFQAAWGSAPPVLWRAPDAKADEEPVTYSRGELVPLGSDRYALISEGQGGDGHVSAGALAVHYLTRSGTGFSRTGAWPNLVVGGTFGSPPQWSVRTDLTPAPAVVTEAGGTWQGYSCSWSDVVELTPERPVLRADGIPVAYSSDGARGDAGEEMEGELTPDMKGRSFSVRYSGDRSVAVRYALQGERYEAMTRPELLTC